MSIKIISISTKFGAKISHRISSKNKSYPYSATEHQIRKQQYGAKYSDAIYKEGKELLTYEYERDGKNSSIIKDAIKEGCKIEFGKEAKKENSGSGSYSVTHKLEKVAKIHEGKIKARGGKIISKTKTSKGTELKYKF